VVVIDDGVSVRLASVKIPGLQYLGRLFASAIRVVGGVGGRPPLVRYNRTTS
jgi:hypothetical protein